MLKPEETYPCVDDEAPSYEPDAWQGSLREEQKVEFGALHQRSLLPVSSTKRKSCPGVPRVMLQK